MKPGPGSDRVPGLIKYTGFHLWGGTFQRHYDSAVSNSAKTAGTVVAARVKAKIKKYQGLTEKYIFVPLVVVSHGRFYQEVIDFFFISWEEKLKVKVVNTKLRNIFCSL